MGSMKKKIVADWKKSGLADFKTEVHKRLGLIFWEQISNWSALEWLRLFEAVGHGAHIGDENGYLLAQTTEIDETDETYFYVEKVARAFVNYDRHLDFLDAYVKSGKFPPDAWKFFAPR